MLQASDPVFFTDQMLFFCLKIKIAAVRQTSINHAGISDEFRCAFEWAADLNDGGYNCKENKSLLIKNKIQPKRDKNLLKQDNTA